MPYWFPVSHVKVVAEDGSVALVCTGCSRTIKTFAEPPTVTAVIKAGKGHRHKH